MVKKRRTGVAVKGGIWQEWKQGLLKLAELACISQGGL